MKRRLGQFAVLLLATIAFLSPAPSAAQDIKRVGPIEEPIPIQIETQTHRLMASMRRGDLRSARSRLERLVSLRVTGHIANLTPVAAAFLSRFDQVAVDESTEDVYELAALAVQLAPDYPQIHFNLSSAYLAHGVQMIGRATSSFVSGLLAYARYPRGLVILVSNIAFYLTFSILMMVLIVSVILLLHHGRTLAHDVGDLFPSAPAAAFSAPEVARSRSIRFIIQSGLTRTLALFVMLLMLFLPVAAGLGLLLVALIWALFTGVYARRSELATVTLVHLGIICILPLSIITHLPLDAEKAEGATLWSCLREYCWSEKVEQLNLALLREPDDPWVATALALHKVHDGLGETESLRRASRQLMGVRLDSRGSIATLRGNIQILHALSLCPDGKPDEGILNTARQSFQSAIRSVPDAPEAHRGLAMTEGLLRDREALEAGIARLVEVSQEEDLTFVARIRTLSGSSQVCTQLPSISAMLRTPPPPNLSTFFRGLDVVNAPEALAFREIMLGQLPIRWLPAVAGISLILLLAVLVVRRRFSFAYTCPRCGGVSCVRCNVGASGFDYCPTCLMEQVRPAFLDPLDLVALQRKQNRKRNWQRLFSPMVSLLVPGSRQIMSGRPLRGLFMIGCLAFAVGFVLNPPPSLVDHLAYVGRPGSDLPTLPPVLLGMVYFWSALDIWLTRRR